MFITVFITILQLKKILFINFDDKIVNKISFTEAQVKVKHDFID